MHFNINAPFWQFMNTLARFTGLNALFVITCVPVVTIGPARAALYGTLFAYNDHDDVALHREYLRRLKREFKQGILSMPIFIAVAAIIIFGFAFWGNLDSDLAYVGLIVLIIASVVCVLCFEYFHPVQARYENTFGRIWQLALMLPWASFAHAIILLSIDVIFVALIYFIPFLRAISLIFGFAWVAYAKSLVFLRVFAKFSTPTHLETPTYVNNSGSL